MSQFILKRPVGRPSLAVKRREEILEAFVECIRRYGLDGATVDKVAAELGVSRALVFHYFGDRHRLVDAVLGFILDRETRRLTDALEGVPVEKRARAILEFAFEGPQFSELRDVVVQAEIIALAGRDENVRSHLADMWERYLEVVTTVLECAFPEAGAHACRATGYALACLAEQHWWMVFMGPGRKRREWARQAGEELLASLAARSEGRRRHGRWAAKGRR